jgi:hypothetical protein
MNRVAAPVIAEADSTEFRTIEGPEIAVDLMARPCRVLPATACRMVRRWDLGRVALVLHPVEDRQVANCKNFTSRSRNSAVPWRKCAANSAGTTMAAARTAQRMAPRNRVAATVSGRRNRVGMPMPIRPADSDAVNDFAQRHRDHANGHSVANVVATLRVVSVPSK